MPTSLHRTAPALEYLKRAVELAGSPRILIGGSAIIGACVLVFGLLLGVLADPFRRFSIDLQIGGQPVSLAAIRPAVDEASPIALYFPAGGEISSLGDKDLLRIAETGLVAIQIDWEDKPKGDVSELLTALLPLVSNSAWGNGRRIVWIGAEGSAEGPIREALGGNHGAAPDFIGTFSGFSPPPSDAALPAHCRGLALWASRLDLLPVAQARGSRMRFDETGNAARASIGVDYNFYHIERTAILRLLFEAASRVPGARPLTRIVRRETFLTQRSLFVIAAGAFSVLFLAWTIRVLSRAIRFDVNTRGLGFACLWICLMGAVAVVLVARPVDRSDSAKRGSLQLAPDPTETLRTGDRDDRDPSEVAWHASLWRYFHPRTKTKRNDWDRAVVVLAALRERVTISGAQNLSLSAREAWAAGTATPDQFRRIYATALRAIAVPSRIQAGQVEIRWGGEWIATPQPLAFGLTD